MTNNIYNQEIDLSIITQDKESKENKTSQNLIKKSVKFWDLQFAYSNKYDIAIVILASVFSVFLGASYNLYEYLQGKATNHLIPNANVEANEYFLQINKDCIFFLISSLLTFLIAFCHYSLWNYNGKKLALKYKMEYFRIILAQDVTWFDSQNVYEIASRVESQLKSIEQGVNYF